MTKHPLLGLIKDEMRTAHGTESELNDVSRCYCCYLLNTYYVPDTVGVISLSPYKHSVRTTQEVLHYCPHLQMRPLELREAESPA